MLKKVGEFAYETRKTPELPTSKHVLVKIVATGICGSDVCIPLSFSLSLLNFQYAVRILTPVLQVHYWKHGGVGPFQLRCPCIMGHESAGIIVRRGADATQHELGTRVAIEPGVPCRTCSFCRGGKYNLCDEMRFAATPPIDGTLATYYAVPEDFCYKLPDHISIEEGALVEPLSVAVHCAKLANISKGQSVLVMGAGPIGLLCCAVAKAFGASEVVVTDIVDSRLEFAKRYAGVKTYKMERISGEENARNIQSQCGVSTADVVIEATGVAACINAGIFALKKGGVFVQAGLGASDIQFPVGELCSKEGVYKTSFRYGPGDYELAVKLIESGEICLKDLITHHYEFSSAEQAFKDIGHVDGIKSIIYGPRD